jgi:hypothetical protein
VEIPTWTLAVTRLDGGSRAVVDVPAALTGTPAGGRFELVGLVTVGETTDPVGAGAVLARYGARHTSPTWFRTLGALLDHDRFVVTTDRVTARHAIERLLSDSV